MKVLSRLRRAGDGEPAEGAEQLRRIEAVSDAALAHLNLDDLLSALLERVSATEFESRSARASPGGSPTRDTP